MLIQTPFKSLTSASTRRRPTRWRSPASRLCLERLEGRRLLSTYSVVNFLDSGPGSLREAIVATNSAPGPDLIRFAPAARDGTIALAGGQLSITDDLTIDGPGADRLAVSGNDASRVFRIGGGVEVSINGLTVTHGRAVGQGGGILNATGLDVRDSIVRDNTASAAGPSGTAQGGGIWNGDLDYGPSVELALRNVTVTDNTLSGTPGLPVQGGGLFTAFPVTLHDTVLAGNAPDQCFGC